MNCGRSRALRASQSILTAISYGNRANDYYHTRPRLGARLGDAERNDRHRGRSIACRARRLHGRTAAKLCAPSFSGSFFKRIRDEFGAQIWPTVTMISEDAPKSVRTVSALGVFGMPFAYPRWFQPPPGRCRGNAQSESFLLMPLTFIRGSLAPMMRNG